ncbi:MAG: hypothetical protein QOH17_4385, partial [Pseudonocardiales bacterium]|nr:hypothetical protein [Pseudonocardiales bacterium]
LDGLATLPAPQRDALATAFGLHHGTAPDRFLVGLAVLNLLSEAAESEPLLLVADDVQWLDQASVQALAFVARRLLAEAVALVFAVRERETLGLDDEPDLAVLPLTHSDARTLFDEVVPGPLDERVRDRIIAETRGNPLALLELPRGRLAAELAGEWGALDEMPVAGRIEREFALRIAPLPVDTKRLLLIAAAEPLGDVALFWRAAERAGISADAATGAEAAGLLEIGVRVRFRHPLVRSAAYHSAEVRAVRQAHAVLAEVTDAARDPDRRAWHRAQASATGDETVAAELERSAGRAQARGGVAAAAAFLQRATELTPEPTRRGARALAAAQAKFDASAPDAAETLLATAALCPLDELQRARLERLRAQLTFVRRPGSDAPSLLLLLDAARRLETLDVELARETYLQALLAGVFTGKLGRRGELRQVAEAARAAPAGLSPPRALDLLLDGLAVRFTDGSVAAVAPLQRALFAFANEQGRQAIDVHGLWLAWPSAYEVWDDDAWHHLTIRLVDVARELGALTVLPLALVYRAQLHVQAGQLETASALLDEVDLLKGATGPTPLMYTSTSASARLVIAAWRGQEAEALDLIQDSIREGTVRGEGRAVSLAQFALAVLYNGLGRYDLARAAARQVCVYDDLALYGWGLVELIESAVRHGDTEAAEEAMTQLQTRTQAAGTDWALGVEARCRALLSEPPEAERCFREAIDRLGRTYMRVALARAHLLYGEWLRREGRRTDARDHLRIAHTMLTEMGTQAFAERARRELIATGATARKRRADTRDDLTPQEAQIARLAADGLTSPEIAVELFLSARTVEWHLHKVFTKLSISSRRELRTALPRRPG